MRRLPHAGRPRSSGMGLNPLTDEEVEDIYLGALEVLETDGHQGPGRRVHRHLRRRWLQCRPRDAHRQDSAGARRGRLAAVAASASSVRPRLQARRRPGRPADPPSRRSLRGSRPRPRDGRTAALHQERCRRHLPRHGVPAGVRLQHHGRDATRHADRDREHPRLRCRVAEHHEGHPHRAHVPARDRGDHRDGGGGRRRSRTSLPSGPSSQSPGRPSRPSISTSPSPTSLFRRRGPASPRSSSQWAWSARPCRPRSPGPW